MLTAYFDDGGSHDTHAQVVLGFVSTVDQWLSFDNDWRCILAMPHFDLEHPHMKELRNGKGRFAKFRDNLSLQSDLFDRLQSIMRIRTLETFGGAIILKDYAAVNRDYMVAEQIEPPLVMAAQLAIVKVMMWRDARYPKMPIKIVVDQGIDHWGILDERVYEQYGFRLIPGCVRETPPLQASDHAAWELHRALAQIDGGYLPSLSQLRGSLRAFLKRFSPNGADMDTWFIYEETEMRRVFDQQGVPTPRSDV